MSDDADGARVTRAVRYADLARWPERADSRPGDLVASAARRCVVFRQASGLGWYLFPPFDATVVWRGGCDFEIAVDDELAANIWPQLLKAIHGFPSPWCCSKIEGVLQVDPGIFVATPPGIKILMTAPLNRPNTNYWTQSGVQDTDWFHVPNTVNLQVWNRDVRFELKRTEPIAQLVPLAWDVAEGLTLQELDISEDAIALEQWRAYVEESYGQDAFSGVLSNRRPGVYRRWKQRAEVGTRNAPGNEGDRHVAPESSPNCLRPAMRTQAASRTSARAPKRAE